MTSNGEGAGQGSVLFEAYHDRILRYIAGMVRDPAEAEDLAQDTFLHAYAAHGTLRDPEAVRGWLYRIATRVCVDRLRQRVPCVLVEGEDGARLAENTPAGEPSALEIFERAETSACVERCLDHLSDRYRAVVLLHEAHSLTAQEIADMLGESLASVKIRLHRARTRLRQVMDIGCAVSASPGGVPCCQPKKL